MSDAKKVKDAGAASGFTVQEIARRIQRPFENLNTVVDRIRGWGDLGLIDVLGDKHPGTGRKRTYATSALIDALTFTALTDAGLPVLRTGSWGQASTNVRGLSRRAAVSIFAQGSAETFYLVIGGRSSKTTPPTIYAVELHTSVEPIGWLAKDADWTVVINLSNLFKDVDFSGVKPWQPSASANSPQA
jgi:hypothetical protein